MRPSSFFLQLSISFLLALSGVSTVYADSRQLVEKILGKGTDPILESWISEYAVTQNAEESVAAFQRRFQEAVSTRKTAAKFWLLTQSPGPSPQEVAQVLADLGEKIQRKKDLYDRQTFLPDIDSYKFHAQYELEFAGWLQQLVNRKMVLGGRPWSNRFNVQSMADFDVWLKALSLPSIHEPSTHLRQTNLQVSVRREFFDHFLKQMKLSKANDVRFQEELLMKTASHTQLFIDVSKKIAANKKGFLDRNEIARYGMRLRTLGELYLESSDAERNQRIVQLGKLFRYLLETPEIPFELHNEVLWVALQLGKNRLNGSQVFTKIGEDYLSSQMYDRKENEMPSEVSFSANGTNYLSNDGTIEQFKSESAARSAFLDHVMTKNFAYIPPKRLFQKGEIVVKPATFAAADKEGAAIEFLTKIIFETSDPSLRIKALGYLDAARIADQAKLLDLKKRLLALPRDAVRSEALELSFFRPSERLKEMVVTPCIWVVRALAASITIGSALLPVKSFSR